MAGQVNFELNGTPPPTQRERAKIRRMERYRAQMANPVTHEKLKAKWRENALLDKMIPSRRERRREILRKHNAKQSTKERKRRHEQVFKERHPEYFRDKQILRQYGLTRQERDELFAKNDGLCWVCGQNPATDIDHDHNTGRVRGALCYNCNRALGHAKDNPKTLRSLADYLEGGS
jgi:hypothetical protein